LVGYSCCHCELIDICCLVDSAVCRYSDDSCCSVCNCVNSICLFCFVVVCLKVVFVRFVGLVVVALLLVRFDKISLFLTENNCEITVTFFT
jgi:hypothetical protein